jgi:transposase
LAANRYSSINLYFGDESRFGLFTRAGRTLTAKGVKPICKFQQVFLSTYLFGAFSPITGDSFLLELPLCNGNTFQIFLDRFSLQNEKELKLLVLDNGAFHKAKSLKIPDNIMLIFLPPYSPELNPAEKIWAKFKRQFTNQFFKTISELEEFVCTISKTLTGAEVKSICGYGYIFADSFWSVK